MHSDHRQPERRERGGNEEGEDMTNPIYKSKDRAGRNYYIKEDLREEMGEG